MQVVYIDVVFVINFVMDAIILYAAGWMAKKKINLWRLLLGSTIGAGYSLLIFVPESTSILFSVLAKLSFSCLIVWTAFKPLSFMDFLRMWGLFYLSSFVIGGAAYASNSVLGETRLLGGMVWVSGSRLWDLKMLLPLMLVSVPLVFWIGGQAWKRMERFRRREDNYWKVQIAIDGGLVEITGLLDTGNALADPLSRLPVAVVEWEALQTLLPSAVVEMYREHKNPVVELADKSLEGEWQTRFRFVPYRGVGGTMGMLLAFRPTKFQISQQERQIDVTKILVAINPHSMSGDRTYQAILPLDSLSGHDSALAS